MENNDQEDEFAFANALGDSQVDNEAGDASADDGADKDESGYEQRIKELQSQLEEQKILVEEANGRLSKFDKFANAFKDDEPSEDELKERSIREFDIDPLTGVKRIVGEDIDSLRKEINDMKSTRIAEKAMANIDRDYDVRS